SSGESCSSPKLRECDCSRHRPLTTLAPTFFDAHSHEKHFATAFAFALTDPQPKHGRCVCFRFALPFSVCFCSSRSFCPSFCFCMCSALRPPHLLLHEPSASAFAFA